MVAYEFRCPNCREVFTELRDPNKDKRAECPVCGEDSVRIYSATLGHIDWVNGGWKGEEVNMGTGKFHKSARERDYYAESIGLEKA